MRQNCESTILDIQDLKIYFPINRGILQRKVGDIKAIDGITFIINRGETLGLVGESGCGKTTTGRAILGLYQPTGGHIFFEGVDISSLKGSDLRRMPSKISMIFQDPYSSLDPRQTAGSIVAEPMLIHQMASSKRDLNDKMEHLFRIVGLDPCLADRYPHEFSGGQRQRIGIARALASNPSLIVCDEPISALDVSIQAQIINLLEELQEGMKGLSYLFIAHDLSVVRHISDRVAVMYLGRIVEITKSRELYNNPLHPYTKALLSAIPIPDPFVEERRERIILKGEVPHSMIIPPGCSFHPRCPMAIADCSQVVPPLIDVVDGHAVACINLNCN